MWFSVVILIQTYTEKEQAEQGKLQNVQFGEKGDTRNQNGVKSCVHGDKMIKEKLDIKWCKRGGNLTVRHPSPTELSFCEKELKFLGSGLVVYMFALEDTDQETGARLFLSSRPSWKNK